MILISFIILGHHDWKKAHIKIFNICSDDKSDKNMLLISELVKTGRLPITPQNINIILKEPGISTKSIIKKYSENEGHMLIGIREEMVKHEKEKLFEGYDDIGSILFVHSKTQKLIE